MIRAAALALTATVLLAACGSTSTSQTIRLAGPIHVAVGSDDRYSCFVNAAKMGAFAAYGLDVRLVVTAPAATVDALRTGGAEVAATDVSTAVYAGAVQPDLRLVGIYLTSKDFVRLFARSGAPSVPRDGTLGVVPDSSSEAAAAHLLAAYPGLRVSVTTADTLPAALRGKAIDYAFASGTGANLVATGARQTASGSDFGYDYEQGLVTSGQWLSGHASEVLRLNEALATGCRNVGELQSPSFGATLTFKVRAPSGADVTNYTMELGRHTGRAVEAAATVSTLVRQDLVADSNTLTPGCDCQWLPSPSPAS